LNNHSISEIEKVVSVWQVTKFKVRIRITITPPSNVLGMQIAQIGTTTKLPAVLLH